MHREDGPAEERPDGVKLWYRRGKLHRDDGPAGEGPNGKYWFRNGKWHREDGPAIELADGRTEWFIDGVKLTPEQVAEFKERQVQAIADPFRTGLDHKTTVRPIGKLKTGSAVRKLEGEKRDTK